MILTPLEHCKIRFANGQALASVVFNGERVSRFEDGYSVEPKLLWLLTADARVCCEDVGESNDCVRVFIPSGACRLAVQLAFCGDAK